MISNAMRTRWKYAGALLAAIPVALLVLASIGGLTETTLVGIPVVPVYTLFGLPIDLIIRDVAMAATIGFALVGGVLTEQPDPKLGKMTSLFALVWLVTLVFQAWLTVSEVLALSARESLDPVIVQSLLTQTTTGQVILAQFVLVALVAILGWVVLGRVTGWIVVVLACVAAFLPGLTGHSGISDGHNAASIGLGLHLIFMGVWVGGLLALTWYLNSRTDFSPAVVRSFSIIALVSVIVIAESGLLNASMRIDGIAPYLTSVYGSIILAKVAVLIVLIGYGWRHRVDLATSPAGAWKGRMLNLALVELVWMGIVIGLAVALSRTAAPAYALGTDPVDFGSLSMVALGIPLAIVVAFPRLGRSLSPQLFVKYPEMLAIIFVVAIYAVSEVMMTGALASTIGVQAAALVLGAGLFIFGLLFVATQRQQRSPGALGIVFLGWVANIYWQLAQREQAVTLGVGLVTALVALMLAYLAFPGTKDSVAAIANPRESESITT